MKKLPALLLALLLLFPLAACGTTEAPITDGTLDETPAATPEKPTDGNPPSSPESPDTPAPLYFIVGGNLVGSWENDTWRSLNDPSGRYEDAYSNTFYFKDILSQSTFALYTRDDFIGDSDCAIINGGAGVSGFEDGDKADLFAPYAEPDTGGQWPGSMKIPLPAAFGPEMDELKIPFYGYSLSFFYENASLVPNLATNSSADLNPNSFQTWGDVSCLTDADRAALQERLTENGINAEAAVSDVLILNTKDGAEQSLFFANTPTTEDGCSMDVSKEDGGTYSLLLLHRENGSYETIFERYQPYTDDMSAYFVLSPVGVYDLNGDGRYEVCAVMGEWESGYTMVLSQSESGTWETVLRANWGS